MIAKYSRSGGGLYSAIRIAYALHRTLAQVSLSPHLLQDNPAGIILEVTTISLKYFTCASTY